MKYKTKITSKGTITIAAPVRKSLHLETGREVKMFVNERNNIEIEAGISIEEFEKIRDEVMSKTIIPEHLKGLTARELRDLIGPEAYD